MPNHFVPLVQYDETSSMCDEIAAPIQAVIFEPITELADNTSMMCDEIAAPREALLFEPIAKIILTDFESGLIECLRNQFPRADHLGCHFHFTQAVWHKVQNLGLVSAYHNKDNTEIAEFIQLCMALAFIPKVEIASQFEECITN